MNMDSLPMVLCEELIANVLNDQAFLSSEDGKPKYFKMAGEIMHV